MAIYRIWGNVNSFIFDPLVNAEGGSSEKSSPIRFYVKTVCIELDVNFQDHRLRHIRLVCHNTGAIVYLVLLDKRHQIILPHSLISEVGFDREVNPPLFTQSFHQARLLLSGQRLFFESAYLNVFCIGTCLARSDICTSV